LTKIIIFLISLVAPTTKEGGGIVSLGQKLSTSTRKNAQRRAYPPNPRIGSKNGAYTARSSQKNLIDTSKFS